jgi:hypothetical protein
MRLPIEWFRSYKLRRCIQSSDWSQTVRMNQVRGCVASGMLKKGRGGFSGGWLRGLEGCFVIWPCWMELLNRELPVSSGQQCQRYNNVKDGRKL